MNRCNHNWESPNRTDSTQLCRKCGRKQHGDPSIQYYVDDRTFKARPILAPNLVLREGDPNSELCQLCGSSVKKQFWCFGKIVGCYNDQCPNFHLRNK